MYFTLSCESLEGCKELLTSLKGLSQVPHDLAARPRHEMPLLHMPGLRPGDAS